jgi:hypothetical protein
MADYKFEQFKVTIKKPSWSISLIEDTQNGLATVHIVLYMGNINNKTASFGVPLEGFTYVDNWTQSEVEAWVTTELIKYEV